jgi:hypothetical protein
VLKQKTGLFFPSRGCDCNPNVMPGEMLQQLIRPGQRAKAGNRTPENEVMPLLELMQAIPRWQFLGEAQVGWTEVAS